MKYKYVIPTFCIFGTISLCAHDKELANILLQVSDKTVLTNKAIRKKNSPKKRTHFVFLDEYDTNGIGLKNKTSTKNKSETYNYNNKSRFKFKFNNGSEQSNFVGRYGSAGGGSLMSSGGAIGGGTGARGRGGGRR